MSLAYFEWSALPGSDFDDPAVWAEANPALGIRISEEYVARERDAMPEPEFARERLGIPDDPQSGGVLDPTGWDELTDLGSVTSSPWFALDVPPDHSAGAIGVAGFRSDGLMHVEVAHQSGTGWIVGQCAKVTKTVLVDPASAAGSLIGPLQEAGVNVVTVSAREYGHACGQFYDRVLNRTVRHLGQEQLANAVRAAKKRTLGDAWAWHRRGLVDISPLVAVTLASWKASQRQGDSGYMSMTDLLDAS